MGTWEGYRRSHQSINVILYFLRQVPETALQRQWRRQLDRVLLRANSSRRYSGEWRVVTSSSNLVSTSSSPHLRLYHIVLMPSVLCALVEDCRPFVVDFDLDWIVERLKEAIKAKRRRALGGFDECDFTLYKGELDQSVKMAREIKLLSENLHTCTELENPNRALSTIFQNPPTGHEHIVLVRTPQGESIYCGGVVLMTDLANATRPRSCAIGLPEVPSIQYLHPGVSIDTTLRFISTQPRVFDEDLLRNNDITKESNPPSQISLIRENLEKPRPVTKQQQV